MDYSFNLSSILFTISQRHNRRRMVKPAPKRSFPFIRHRVKEDPPLILLAEKADDTLHGKGVSVRDP
jgi:hypothetical protein